MDSTNILRNEHAYIRKVLAEIRRQCIGIVNGNDVDFELFAQIIDFVRNFADKYHHQKEERNLFNVMADKLINDVGPGPIQGMLTEHSFGRDYIYELEQALKRHQDGDMDAKVDVVGYAMTYMQMLTRHIDKEDKAVFLLAERKLDEPTKNKLDEEFRNIEAQDENVRIRKKYMDFADSL